jgi:NAD(P)-dependent dehydrogenase (short-subunit alcohol dehydrogenase family)
MTYVNSELHDMNSKSAENEPRRAVVTGAGNGLGLAIARKIASNGASVLLVDCDPIVLSRAQEREFSSTNSHALVSDLAEPDAAVSVFREVSKRLGTADILINNAAWSFHKPLLEVTLEEFDRLVAINQRSPYFLAQEFLRQIVHAEHRPQDAAIVNIASVNAMAGNPNLVAYAGTKGALVAMTRALAVEMKDIPVRVNCICPAAVKTFVTSNLIDSGVIDPPKLFEPYLIKRFASCEEIAELVAYLCSPYAGFVTGANWEIDGGYLAQ